MEDSPGAEGLEFKWGKKRGVGGKKKDVQFYESFTYDGDEYCLYDCVLVANTNEPDFTELYVGKIIKIWEHTNKRAKVPRQVKLLWFFKPSDISAYLEEVPDVLANELFLASGEGLGLANVNQLEAIGGKCSVLCISKDKRNPQPSDQEIRSADFVFRRAFDVGSLKVLDTIDDKIAGVDVKFLFNRAGREKEASAVPKIEADINAYTDSLKPNGPSAGDSVKRIEDNSTEYFECRKSSNDCKEGKEKGHNQLATEKITPADERSKKESGVQEGTARNEHDSCDASVSRGNHCDGKAQETEVKKKFTKQISLPAEGRYSNSCEASGSRLNDSDSKKALVSDVKKQLTKQKSMPAEERYRRDSNGLDDRPQKKQRLDGKKDTGSFKRPRDKETREEVSPEKYSSVDPGVSVREGKDSSDGKKDTGSFRRPRDKETREEVPPENYSSIDPGVSVREGKDSSDGKKDTGSFKRPRDKETREEVPPEKYSSVKNQDPGVSVCEGKVTKTADEKGLPKKPRFDDRLLQHTKEKLLTADNERNYQVIEVSRRPDAVKSKWFQNLPWEEDMKEAEEKGTLVLLQNLDPTYTSDEVEDIVYSALKEQCRARMVECTPVTIHHIGKALVIFKSREAAKSAIRRLDEGCLVLSKGRPLVATFAKINPPRKPSPFPGHIKVLKTLTRRETRDAVATSHCSQPNNLEFELAMEWLLHRAKSEQAMQTISKRQLEQKKSLQMNFKHP